MAKPRVLPVPLPNQAAAVLWRGDDDCAHRKGRGENADSHVGRERPFRADGEAGRQRPGLTLGAPRQPALSTEDAKRTLPFTRH